MSLIKYKSEENLEAAKLLNDNKKFTSSVHCSYYAVLQIMKYALNEKCHISYEKQNEPKDKDSHIYIRDEILYQLRSIQTKESIKRSFDAAKALRRKADYLDLYNDRTNPQSSNEYWNDYFSKIKLLSRFERK